MAEQIPFNGDSLFFCRGRLAGAPRQRNGRWLITIIVRNGNEVYFPTVMLPGEPPEELKFRQDAPLRYQPLVSVVGVLQTRNVSYSTFGEIAYILRRAGFPGLIPLLEKLIPARVRQAPQRHVRYNLLATDITVEEIPKVPPEGAGATGDEAVPEVPSMEEVEE